MKLFSILIFITLIGLVATFFALSKRGDVPTETAVLQSENDSKQPDSLQRKTVTFVPKQTGFTADKPSTFGNQSTEPRVRSQQEILAEIRQFMPEATLADPNVDVAELMQITEVTPEEQAAYAEEFKNLPRADPNEVPSMIKVNPSEVNLEEIMNWGR